MFCHSPVLGLPDIVCETVFPISQFPVPRSLLTRTLLLLCFPTSAQMGIHYLPWKPTKPLLLVSHHCLRLRLPSRGSAGILTPTSPAGLLAAGGTLALMDSGGRLLHTHFRLPSGMSGSEPSSPNPPEPQAEHGERTGPSTPPEENELCLHLLT